ncbi:MAG: S8 family serine peptidase [Defluviitaleaceae bacterium]|nr:S8 family serine peptidase [Defluviitaleaceae bacterium]MCL2240025.1 S8 family serine peptidase [Defluviitaleaceae bacterium]
MPSHHDNFVPGKVLIAIDKNHAYPDTASCHKSILQGIDYLEAHIIFSAGEYGEYEGNIGDILLVHLVEQSKLAVLEWVAHLSAHPYVLHAEPDFIFECLITPNDRYYPYLWGMEKINAAAAWAHTVGKADVIVGVIDSGVDYTHPDITQNLWRTQDGYYGWNFYDANPDSMDFTGHGTHVAGTIGAVGNNVSGVTGVCWRVQIASFKIGNEVLLLDAAIAAIIFAMQNNIPILNNSWGTRYPSEILRNVIGMYKGLFVAAAGNSGQNSDIEPMYPAAFDNDNILSVASIEPDDSLSAFSNYGAKTIDIAAPGNQILSLGLHGEYSPQRGTSMAAPHVAGAAALLKSYNPHLTTAEIKQIILASAAKRPQLAQKLVTGGILDMAAMFEFLTVRSV